MEIIDYDYIDNHVDKSVDTYSPTCGDVERIVKLDEEGNEIIEFVGVNYKILESTRGSVFDYQLDKLLAAGVDPAFPVHTGMNSRIEGTSVVHSIMEDINTADIDSILGNS